MSRAAFLETLETAAAFLVDPAIAERWDQPSALEGYTVGGLAGHTARAAITVERALTQPGSTDTPIDAVAYFLRGAGDLDPITSEEHQTVRLRGEKAGSIGPRALAGEVGAIRRRLAVRFHEEPPKRRVQVYGDDTMLLDDYLQTRLVELVVHLDDLAASAGIPPPQMREDVVGTVLGILVKMSTARHGPQAVIRALARRERAEEWPSAF